MLVIFVVTSPTEAPRAETNAQHPAQSTRSHTPVARSLQRGRRRRQSASLAQSARRQLLSIRDHNRPQRTRTPSLPAPWNLRRHVRLTCKSQVTKGRSLGLVPASVLVTHAPPTKQQQQRTSSTTEHAAQGFSLYLVPPPVSEYNTFSLLAAPPRRLSRVHRPESAHQHASFRQMPRL